MVFSSDEEAHYFFGFVNHIHKSINFTQEQECNGQFAFLDVLASRTTGNVAQTSVFRKKTHTGLHLKWTIFVLFRYKRNLEHSLLQRAYNIGSSYKLIHNDFTRIKDMLAKNGNPRTFVDDCIWGFLNSKHTDTKTTNQITTQPTQKHLTCRLPFLRPTSMQVQYEIGNFFTKNTNGKIKVRLIHDTFKFKSFFESKKVKHYYIGQMWSIIFIALAVATALVRLPEICLHDSTNITPAAKNVNAQTLPTISMKIPTMKLTLQNLEYLEVLRTELSSTFWKL